MAMFWEFFTFELKFRFKSVSTYIYFLLWFTYCFLSVASESFGPIGNNNGKILLNGPYANIYNDIAISFFGLIVIAAIFGTSILRDFQRDDPDTLHQTHLEVCLPRWPLGRLFCRDGFCLFGSALR